MVCWLKGFFGGGGAGGRALAFAVLIMFVDQFCRPSGNLQESLQSTANYFQRQARFGSIPPIFTTTWGLPNKSP